MTIGPFTRKVKNGTDQLKSGTETIPIIFVKKYTHAILGHDNSFQNYGY